MRVSWKFAKVLGVAFLLGCSAKGDTEAAKEGGEKESSQLVEVRVEPAVKGPLIVTVEGLGRCEPLPDRVATLTPAVEGHVHSLPVKQGETVKKGQAIVELDKSVAQADLAEKTATRDGLIASLALLKSIPRPEEQKANRLAIEQAKIALDRAKRVADHMRPLLDRHEISEQQMLDAEQAVDQARLQWETAKSQLQVTLIGPRAEAIKEAEGKIKTADGAVAFSKAHLEYHTIRSPIDGVLDSLTCHPGQTIAIGANIGEVVDTRQVYATLWLGARSASSVKVGQSAKVRSADLDSGEDSQELVGRVAFVGRVADPQTGNLPVRILVDNPDGRLTLGESVTASIEVKKLSDVIQVSSSAVYDLGEGPVLNVVRNGKTATLHPKVSPAGRGKVALRDVDLKAGEPVIVDGGYNLPEDTPVKIAEVEKAKADEPKAAEKTSAKRNEAEAPKPSLEEAQK